MGRVIYLKPVKEEKNVVIFPLFRILFDKIKSVRNDILKRKIEFLYKQAYQYFYDVLEPVQYSFLGVDIHACIYEEQRKKRANDEATQAVLQVIKDGRVDECYKRRMKDLKTGR